MILPRYWMWMYLRMVALALTALVVLVVAVTLVEKAGILANHSAGSSIAWRMALSNGLEYSYQMLPLACLIGFLATTTRLSQRGELLALQAAGATPRHTLQPFVWGTCLLMLLELSCAEILLPWTTAERSRVLQDMVHHTDALTQFYEHRHPWYQDGHYILYLPLADRTERRFETPKVYEVVDGHWRARITADALVFDAQEGWALLAAKREPLDQAPVTFAAHMPLPLHVSPEDLLDITGHAREMRFGALHGLIQRRTRAGFDTTAHRIEWHNRMAYPLCALGLVSIVMPWGIDPRRRRGLAGTLGLGMLVIALFLAGAQIMHFLALAHQIPVPLGAWGGNLLLLLATGSSWLYYARRRRYH